LRSAYQFEDHACIFQDFDALEGQGEPMASLEIGSNGTPSGVIFFLYQKKKWHHFLKICFHSLLITMAGKKQHHF